MASLAYIRQLHPNSFVHLSYRGYSWAVRDYKHGVEPIYSNQTTNYSAQDILALAKQPGNYLFDVPLAHGYTDLEFWRDKIQEKNAAFLAANPERKVDIIEEQLSAEEYAMLSSYRRLSAANQKAVVRMISSLLES